MEKLIDRYPKLGSSQDPEKLALRVKSLLLGLVPIAVVVLQMLGVTTFDETTLTELVNLIAGIVMWGAGLFAATMHLWGWIRKFKK